MILATLVCVGSLGAAHAGGVGYIDKSGTVVIEPAFLGGRPFQEEVANVSVGFRIRLLDSRGNFIGGDVYEEALDCSEGLVAVQKGGLWGFVDTNAAIRLDFQFPAACAFADGLALVCLPARYCQMLWMRSGAHPQHLTISQ